MYRVKEVTEISGVSVRTLHYYDEIDLLKPQIITEAGYRIYTNKDLERLQQILFLKELDFSLRKIKKILDDPTFDYQDAMNNHRELLIKKKNRLEAIILSLNKTIQINIGGKEMNKKEMFNGFDMNEIENLKKKYSKEVEEKYGSTDAYKESQEKTKNYNKHDWERIHQEGNEIFNKLASLMDKEPQDIEVQKVIHEWRLHITHNFYQCTIDIFKGLGEIYIEDDRFTKNIDKTKKGLARFLSEAIKIYCE